MDTFAAMLDGPRAREAFLLRVVLDPPYSMRIEDETPVTLVVVSQGCAWICHDDTEPLLLEAGDVAVIRGPDHYTVADTPTTPLQMRIKPDGHCYDLDGRSLELSMTLGVRTWGTSLTGETAMLVGSYILPSHVTPRLMGALPRVLVVRAEDWRSPLHDVMHAELTRDTPGQEVVLDRLLDLLLIETLRVWFAREDSDAPSWWQASFDPVVGPALRALQNDPARPWTVASLAAEVGVSRASLARRFTDSVGETPMAFLTDWRLSLAADRLLAGDETIESIARAVGYSTPFALSVAFKRLHGQSPRDFRRASRGSAAVASSQSARMR